MYPVYSTPSYSAPSYNAPSYRAPTYTPPAAYTPPSTCVPGGTYITIVFQSNATAEMITAFLKEYNVAISDGPNSDGVYRLRLSTDSDQIDKYGQMIDSMRGRKDVVSSIET